MQHAEHLSAIDIPAFTLRFPQLKRAIVASTSSPTTEVAMLLRHKGFDVLEMTFTTPTPIGNAYASPETLGVDRLAAAVAAVEVMGCRDCLVVDFGTAITIDLVEDGVYRGGNISPGVRTRF
jgi:type III pantothenate kinase